MLKKNKRKGGEKQQKENYHNFPTSQSHLRPKAWDAGSQLTAAAQPVALLYFPWFPYVWGTTAIA